MSCPKGYYEKNGRCVKSITIKRKGIYGKGFLSEPQSEQYSKIRREEKIEGPTTVERQMAALNAFQHNHGSAHKDLEYAKKIAHEKPELGHHGINAPCPSGSYYVGTHYKKVNGKTVTVQSHCARNPRR